MSERVPERDEKVRVRETDREEEERTLTPDFTVIYTGYKFNYKLRRVGKKRKKEKEESERGALNVSNDLIP